MMCVKAARKEIKLEAIPFMSFRKPKVAIQDDDETDDDASPSAAANSAAAEAPEGYPSAAADSASDNEGDLSADEGPPVNADGEGPAPAAAQAAAGAEVNTAAGKVVEGPPQITPMGTDPPPARKLTLPPTKSSKDIPQLRPMGTDDLPPRRSRCYREGPRKGTPSPHDASFARRTGRQARQQARQVTLQAPLRYFLGAVALFSAPLRMTLFFCRRRCAIYFLIFL